MTIARVQWAKEQLSGGPLQKLVLMLIADMGGGGACRLSQAGTWALIAEVSEPEVRAACLELADRGLVNLVDGTVEVATPA